MKTACNLQTTSTEKNIVTTSEENEDQSVLKFSNGLTQEMENGADDPLEIIELKDTESVQSNPVELTDENKSARKPVTSYTEPVNTELGNTELLLQKEDGWAAAATDRAVARLGEQLTVAKQELRLRDEEVARLSRIRAEVESELEELTASLFQEAHNMVREANVAKAHAERNLNESQMKVEVLQAEVAALKTLVLTSTPSRPNAHLHPQLEPASTSGMNLFTRSHRRSPSHFNLKYGREDSPPDSPVKEKFAAASHSEQREQISLTDLEVDPVLHKEFLAWRQNASLNRSEPFVERIYREDIELCLEFCNKELGKRVQKAVEAGTLFIESVTEKSRTTFPKKCGLMEVQRLCSYRMRLGDQDQWYHICQMCRNRVTAVCDFLNYLRYIERGLVKSLVSDTYWEITRLRKEIALARLGLPLSN